MKSKFIGDKVFYRRMLALTIPIMLQNGITNLVSMLDNMMVGRIGTVEMTGVAIANQLIFVFNLCIFGAVSGAGIFGAQFYGNGDHEGLRHTFRFKLLFCIVLTAACMALFWFRGDELAMLYLRGEGSATDVAAALSFARRYLNIMIIGLIPYTVVQCYSSTLRETGQTVLPMAAGVGAVIVNLILNYILIFGHWGAPKLGVAGAAIATVISRFVEWVLVSGWTWTHKAQNPFIVGVYRSLRVPAALVKQIAVKGMPLMLNETLWAAGVAMLNQCYSLQGLNVVPANNICQTFFNVFSVAFISVGSAIGIILGQLLGAGKIQEARAQSYRLIAFSLFITVLFSAVFAVFAAYIPRFYNTTDEVRHLATRLMQITALAMPVDAVANATYFTLRSGGKTFITILFDSCFSWFVQVPLAYTLTRCTDIPILALFAVCQATSLIKAAIGYVLVDKGIWIKRIVA